jgi:hypothetical protein
MDSKSVEWIKRQSITKSIESKKEKESINKTPNKIKMKRERENGKIVK